MCKTSEKEKKNLTAITMIEEMFCPFHVIDSFLEVSLHIWTSHFLFINLRLEGKLCCDLCEVERDGEEGR